MASLRAKGGLRANTSLEERWQAVHEASLATLRQAVSRSQGSALEPAFLATLPSQALSGLRQAEAHAREELGATTALLLEQVAMHEVLLEAMYDVHSVAMYDVSRLSPQQVGRHQHRHVATSTATARPRSPPAPPPPPRPPAPPRHHQHHHAATSTATTTSTAATATGPTPADTPRLAAPA